MRKWINLFWGQEKNYTQLASDNHKDIEAYNENILSVLTIVGGAVLLLPLLAVPFSNTTVGAELVMVKVFSVHGEYAPAISFARTFMVWVPVE